MPKLEEIIYTILTEAKINFVNSTPIPLKKKIFEAFKT